MGKKMIIKGVGSLLAKRLKTDKAGQSTGVYEVVTLGTLQNLKIDLNVELEDIFGGDGLFAIDTLVKSKSIEVTATDAKLDLAQLQLMLGSDVREGEESYVWVLNEQKVPTSAGVIDLTWGNTVYNNGEDLQIRLKDDNTLFTKVATSSVGKGQFYVDTTSATKAYTVLKSKSGGVDLDVTLPTVSGVAVTYDVDKETISFNGTATATASKDFEFTYVKGGTTTTETITVAIASGDTAIMIANALKTAIEGSADKSVASEYTITTNGGIRVLVHSDYGSGEGSEFLLNYKRVTKVDVFNIIAEDVPFPVHVVHHGSFLQKDGTWQGIETELYQCRAKGTFSLDATRNTASSQQIMLQVLDPERADGKLGTIKRFTSDKKA